MNQPPTGQGRTSAFLYVDFSDRGAGALLEQPLSYMERHEISGIITNLGGTIIESVTRKLVVSFPRCDDALECARTIRSAVFKLRNNGPTRRGLAYRVLLDHRTVKMDGGKLPMDVADRLSWHISAVQSNTVAAFSDFLANLQNKIYPAPRPIGQSRPDRDPLYLVIAENAFAEEEDETRAASMLSSAGVGMFAELTLRTGARVRVLNPTDCPVSVGRSKTTGVPVNADVASRVHGNIGFENDKFYYADDSRNGTFITIAGGEELHLQRERVVLAGTGHISLGVPRAKQTGEVIDFTCRATRLGFDDEEEITRPN